jgi:hypothetical protein
MIKRVPSTALKVGMYIHDLGADWSQHPFVRSTFALKSDKEIQTIIDCGIREVYIDTDRGLDVPDAPTQQEVEAELDAQMLRAAEQEPAPVIRISTADAHARSRARPPTWYAT